MIVVTTKTTSLRTNTCIFVSNFPITSVGSTQAIGNMSTKDEIQKRIDELGPLIREAQAKEDRLEDYLDEAISTASKAEVKQQYDEAKEEREKLEKEKEELEKKL